MNIGLPLYARSINSTINVNNRTVFDIVNNKKSNPVETRRISVRIKIVNDKRFPIKPPK